ncbi:MAG TPA: roadblock/LC7 domain-containing protein [Actinocrinis sp.]|nr:roadblock/LC7 domain-containing protein [Actinocrinis sp.]
MMSPEEAVVGELRSLRERIAGITDTVVAAADGMLVAADSNGIHPESIAALGSVALGLAKRTAATVGLGSLREVVTRCQSGFVVVYAIGDEALLILLGDEGLNTVGLHAQSRHTIEQLGKLLNVSGL